MAIKQSVSWWCFQGKGIDDQSLLAHIKRIGFSGVELINPSLFKAARDHGLSIASQAAHASINSGLNDLDQLDRITHEVEASLELAGKFQIPNLIVFAGNRQADVTDQEAAEHTVTSLRKLAPLAEQASVTLTLELLNSKVDHSGYQADHTAWGVQVCQQVSSPNVRLLYDIYHMQIMEGDLVRTIQNNHQWFGHYHTAGNPGRNELNIDQEINYPSVFTAIANTGYVGYIGHEFIPTGDPIRSLEDAFELTAESFRNSPTA